MCFTDLNKFGKFNHKIIDLVKNKIIKIQKENYSKIYISLKDNFYKNFIDISHLSVKTTREYFKWLEGGIIIKPQFIRGTNNPLDNIRHRCYNIKIENIKKHLMLLNLNELKTANSPINIQKRNINIFHTISLVFSNHRINSYANVIPSLISEFLIERVDNYINEPAYFKIGKSQKDSILPEIPGNVITRDERKFIQIIGNLQYYNIDEKQILVKKVIDKGIISVNKIFQIEEVKDQFMHLHKKFAFSPSIDPIFTGLDQNTQFYLDIEF